MKLEPEERLVCTRRLEQPGMEQAQRLDAQAVRQTVKEAAEQQTGTRQEQVRPLKPEQPGMEEPEQQIGTQEQGRLLEEPRLEQPGMEAAEQQIVTQQEQEHLLGELRLEQAGMEEAEQ
jgi:hypothetical protein